MSPVMEDDRSDVDDSSEMEQSESNSGSEEENEMETENATGNKRMAESDDHEESEEEKPPLKKIKLSPSHRDIPQQTVIPETQTGDPEFDCSYENINANFFAEELTPDDEILTFQCPKNFDVTSLLNKTIDLKNDTKMKDDVNKYLCQTMKYEKGKKINCVFPSKEKGGVVMKLPVAGHIVLREVVKLPKKSVGSFVDYDVKPVKMPKFDSVKRHPLLGNEWNDHVGMVRKQIKKHKKLLRKSLKHEKSLEKSEKERKELKRKLKDELALLKKKQILESDT